MFYKFLTIIVNGVFQNTNTARCLRCRNIPLIRSNQNWCVWWEIIHTLNWKFKESLINWAGNGSSALILHNKMKYVKLKLPVIYLNTEYINSTFQIIHVIINARETNVERKTFGFSFYIWMSLIKRINCIAHWLTVFSLIPVSHKLTFNDSQCKRNFRVFLFMTGNYSWTFRDR